MKFLTICSVCSLVLTLAGIVYAAVAGMTY